MLDHDKNIYRQFISRKGQYLWRVIYRETDLLVSSDKDISNKIKAPLKEIYHLLDFTIKKYPLFKKSLNPVSIKPFFPPMIKKMCLLSAQFNVGPMAAVAGTVNEFLAGELGNCCHDLFLENGGDLYIKSGHDLLLGVYARNRFFPEPISLKIRSCDTPCGIASSSGTFGHSLSLGKCDLAMAMAESAISSDAAATAVANSINDKNDIPRVMDLYKKRNILKGLLVIKDDALALWGDLEIA